MASHPLAKSTRGAMCTFDGAQEHQGRAALIVSACAHVQRQLRRHRIRRVDAAGQLVLHVDQRDARLSQRVTLQAGVAEGRRGCSQDGPSGLAPNVVCGSGRRVGSALSAVWAARVLQSRSRQLKWLQDTRNCDTRASSTLGSDPDRARPPASAPVRPQSSRRSRGRLLQGCGRRHGQISGAVRVPVESGSRRCVARGTRVGQTALMCVHSPHSATATPIWNAPAPVQSCLGHAVASVSRPTRRCGAAVRASATSTSREQQVAMDGHQRSGSSSGWPSRPLPPPRPPPFAAPRARSPGTLGRGQRQQPNRRLAHQLGTCTASSSAVDAPYSGPTVGSRFATCSADDR